MLTVNPLQSANPSLTQTIWYALASPWIHRRSTCTVAPSSVVTSLREGELPIGRAGLVDPENLATQWSSISSQAGAARHHPLLAPPLGTP